MDHPCRRGDSKWMNGRKIEEWNNHGDEYKDAANKSEEREVYVKNPLSNLTTK